MMKKKFILVGAGAEGVRLFRLLQKLGQVVYCFADNDQKKWSIEVVGKKVIPVDNLKSYEEKYDIVISVSAQYQNEIAKQLERLGVAKYYTSTNLFEHAIFEKNPKISKFENVHKNQKCFIIGTGPSLRIEDLELLCRKECITFASNQIFKIFEKCNWRPDYYMVSDYKIISQYYDEIVNIENIEIFIADIALSNECDLLDRQRLEKDNINVFTLLHKESWNTKLQKMLPDFSSAPDHCIMKGFTVTYGLMQLAAYMGFSEIYLLGVDFDYGTEEQKYKHFIENYHKEGELVNKPSLDKCLSAYQKAEIYSKEHGFKIYNATRGGKLEVFERIDFDSIFES